MRKRLIALACAVALAACDNASPSQAETGETPLPPPAIPDVSNPGVDCQAEDAEVFIGKPVSEETGKALQTATGAEQLQWVLEGQPVNDDYRPNRVRVIYDASGAILVVRCG